MSADLSDNSCAVYAVVDKTRMVREDDQECSMDATPFAVYSVLGMSKSTNGKYTKENETSCKDLDGVNYKNVSSVYSVIDRKNTPGAVHINTIEKSKGGKTSKNPRQILFILVSVILLLLVMIAFIVALAKAYYEISNLNVKIIHTETNSSVNSSQLASNSNHLIKTLQNQLDEVKNNITAHSLQLLSDMEVLKSELSLVRKLSDNTQKSLEVLNSTAKTLSTNLTDVIASNMNLDETIDSFIRNNYSNLERSFNDIELKLQDVANKQRLNSIINAVPLPSSCREIFMQYNSSPSGNYLLILSNGSVATVFCNMEQCGEVTGGWMRVARLNKPNGMAQCYQGLKNYGVTGGQCVRRNDSAGCSPIIFPVFGVQYSHVCGTITGYGKRSPDGFTMRNTRALNQVYVDGISLTYEKNSMIQHIWTFASRIHPNNNPRVMASCNHNKPEFVKENFRCMNLTDNESCPSRNCLPTFYRDLGMYISQDINMRVCRDQERGDEDIILDEVEIFVQ